MRTLLSGTSEVPAEIGGISIYQLTSASALKGVGLALMVVAVAWMVFTIVKMSRITLFGSIGALYLAIVTFLMGFAMKSLFGSYYKADTFEAASRHWDNLWWGFRVFAAITVVTMVTATVLIVRKRRFSYLVRALSWGALGVGFYLASASYVWLESLLLMSEVIQKEWPVWPWMLFSLAVVCVVASLFKLLRGEPRVKRSAPNSRLRLQPYDPDSRR